MAKKKLETRPCRFCGYSFWVERDQCPSCRMNNSEDEGSDGNFGLVPLSSCETVIMNLLQTGDWDINFGYQVDDDGKEFKGHPDTTITLLGGKNGAGKSTLLLQMAKTLLSKNKDKVIIYLSAEEGNAALRARAKRLGLTVDEQERLLISPLGKTISLEPALRKNKPIMLMGDSVSKIAPDPADAVKFCDNLRPLCDELKIPAILLCHINKDGEMGGFEAMQHSVDATLLFTIDTDKIRSLETLKNRNGIEVTTLYKMTAKGLVLHEDPNAEEEEEYDDDE